MPRWYLVRHAETAWNRDNRLQGHTDIPLSPVGFQQAARLAASLDGRPVQAVVSSGLQRARQTAQAIAERAVTPTELLIEPGLSEIHLGQWEGLTPEDVDARFDGAYRQWRLAPSGMRIPGGEPVRAFQQRVRRAQARILSQLSGCAEVAVVTHGGVITALLAEALQAPYDELLLRLRLDNAGVSAIEFAADGAPQVLWINDIHHLDAEAISSATAASPLPLAA